MIDFSYCKSDNVNLNVTLKILYLKNKKNKNNLPDSQIKIKAQLFANNNPLSIELFSTISSTLIWNEWICFPVKYKDLPLNSKVCFSIYSKENFPKTTALTEESKDFPKYSTTFDLFTNHNTIRRGKHRLFLFNDKPPDFRVDAEMNSKDSTQTFDKLIRKHERGDIPNVDWLDKLLFEKIKLMQERDDFSLNDNSDNTFYLTIELPQFDFPLVYNEKEYKCNAVEQTEIDPMVIILDPELFKDNPVENKHRKLVRSQRHGTLDLDLKPNAKIRDELNKILKYPPTQPLNSEEKDLLWKFRFHLSQDKKALTKFLKCVCWTENTEVKQALELLELWKEIDVDDALELLSKDFENKNVRSFAVDQLKRADDEEITFIGEAIYYIGAIFNQNLRYLMVECEDKTKSMKDRTTNLIGKMYGQIAFKLLSLMTADSPSSAISTNLCNEGIHRRDILTRQGELIEMLKKISRGLQSSKDSHLNKIKNLKLSLADPVNKLISFSPLPLPLDPNIHVTEKSSIFKSSVSPLKITFSCSDGSEYPVIFKVGDDLRQDQLVIQLITLMNKLLQKENLDLKLKPYKVLSTGMTNGMVQFVDAYPLAKILSENNGSLLNYLKDCNNGNEDTFMDTYIRSCAGYCVITYILGVGDRHLDNLMLTKQGNLFHIDFGFILGRDPKPFPPPMKLCKEMVEAMGGKLSSKFQDFKDYCFIAFNNLRKSSNLFLNLFNLMVDANITDIAIEPDKAVLKVQEKFRLDLTDEEAIQFFQVLINESVDALFPQVMEKIHQWRQYFD
ncbi:Phosphatidylinositol (PI) 3-kinase [Clydaea vesicula]|uniref:Phosphatidylinositol 3-kinase VPS34 n=1 Tax=Clydaea vesicula TaxID=447962 RepID=A0AAD5U348_9FUNG|nr:Phosphatidylinositol (PI) 3-kinase [Clydaea vesicula]